MATNYNGLTRNTWPGTWSSAGNQPIVLDTEIRGGLRLVSGTEGDKLTDIPGQRLQEGMIVYLAQSYAVGELEFQGQQYYQYKSLEGETRNSSTGELPNSVDNWQLITFGGGGTGSGDGFTGSRGFTGSQGEVGFTGSQGDIGYTGSATNLTVSLINPEDEYSNVILNVNAIRFDTESGFDVFDLGDGEVKIGMNSTFKTWKVDGQEDLIAIGLDTIEFKAGNNVVITTDPNSDPKSITISAIAYTGSQGEVGFTGSIGFTGSQGIRGFTGSRGDIGFTGSIGFAGSQGEVGFVGSQGSPGTGLKITGSATTATELPESYVGDIGDGYLTEDNGHLHVWLGSSWLDVGPVRGPQGFTGSAGVGFTGSGGLIAFGNFDGGEPDSIYGGIAPIDAGGVT
jgi:hypothetical protein